MRPNSFIKLALCFCLVGSILVPSIAIMGDVMVEDVVILDSSEEDNGKESKKELVEQKLFFESHQKNANAFACLENGIENRYLMRHQSIHSDIFLPPPRA